MAALWMIQWMRERDAFEPEVINRELAEAGEPVENICRASGGLNRQTFLDNLELALNDQDCQVIYISAHGSGHAIGIDLEAPAGHISLVELSRFIENRRQRSG